MHSNDERGSPPIGLLEIIGTTTGRPHAYPARLEPVFRLTDSPARIFLPRGAAEPLQLVEESLEWLEEQCEEGSVEPFPDPMPAQPATVLVQLAPELSPEQVPENELEKRLEQFYWKTLQQISTLIVENEWKQALERSSLLFRATHARNSIPGLLQLALLKQLKRQDDADWLKQKLTQTFTCNFFHEDFERFSARWSKLAPNQLKIRTLLEEQVNQFFGLRAPASEFQPEISVLMKAPKPEPNYLFTRRPPTTRQALRQYANAA